jgi:ubiquitin C-terminal hydrolase
MDIIEDSAAIFNTFNQSYVSSTKDSALTPQIIDKDEISDIITQTEKSQQIQKSQDKELLEEKKRKLKKEKEEIQNKIRTRGLSGLSNFGATCYMNAAIQALNATRPFIAYIIHSKSELLDHLQKRILEDIFIEHEKKNIDKEEKDREEINVSIEDITLMAKNKLPYKLRLMMKRLWSNNCEVKPIQLKKYVDKHLKFFTGGFQQHDSQEFLTALLDNIHETTKSVGSTTVKYDQYTADFDTELIDLNLALSNELKKKNDQKDIKQIKNIIDKIDKLYIDDPQTFLKVQSISTWSQLLKSSYSIINDIFSGMHLTTFKCTECKKTSHSFERVDLMSLHLPEIIDPDKESYEIDDLLTLYTIPEIMTNTNKRFCNYCGIKTDSEKKHSIYQSPNTLVIMIKKYQKYENAYFKSNIKIKYDHLLDIKKFVSEHSNNTNTQYELYSVIRHSGGLNGGHYYTYSKNPINDLWYLYDDDSVYNVDDSEPLNCNGYILFYRIV